MDVFRRQMTEDVLTVLKDNIILLVRVPVNMKEGYFPAPQFNGEWNIQNLYAQKVFQVVQ